MVPVSLTCSNFIISRIVQNNRHSLPFGKLCRFPMPEKTLSETRMEKAFLFQGVVL